MQKYVRMTVLIPILLLQREIMSVFPLYISRTKDEVGLQWCLYCHGELLGILCSNFSIFQCTERSPILKQRGAITALYLVTLYIDF